MSRYIKTDIIAKIVFDRWKECEKIERIIPEIRRAIMYEATDDVRENVHATWQRDIVEDAKSGRRIYEGKWVCSNCGCGEDVPTVMGEPTIWNFCPNCGAQMDGGKK